MSYVLHTVTSQTFFVVFFSFFGRAAYVTSKENYVSYGFLRASSVRLIKGRLIYSNNLFADFHTDNVFVRTEQVFFIEE